MNATQLPVSVVTANCPRCRFPATLSVFESGACGDFATYLGIKSGALYRLDLGKLRYLSMDLHALLAPAQSQEGGATSLVKVPHEIICTVCGQQFGGCSMHIDREETVAAFEL